MKMKSIGQRQGEGRAVVGWRIHSMVGRHHPLVKMGDGRWDEHSISISSAVGMSLSLSRATHAMFQMSVAASVYQPFAMQRIEMRHRMRMLTRS
jgi:hypothetical protein